MHLSIASPFPHLGHMGLVVGICQAPCVTWSTTDSPSMGITFEANPYTRPYFLPTYHPGNLYGC